MFITTFISSTFDRATLSFSTSSSNPAISLCSCARGTPWFGSSSVCGAVPIFPPSFCLDYLSLSRSLESATASDFQSGIRRTRSFLCTLHRRKACNWSRQVSFPAVGACGLWSCLLRMCRAFAWIPSSLSLLWYLYLIFQLNTNCFCDYM